jgi:hypothetical protein
VDFCSSEPRDVVRVLVQKLVRHGEVAQRSKVELLDSDSSHRRSEVANAHDMHVGVWIMGLGGG